ncbi:hypothetical protein M408DRAFT_242016 [Serendipita vermifera MAFF 305830]|uniref:Uncharacterized protein n=1 Tax=Serendipita vermifera MAFF 305830 TaxID=933852 RepID=A0A0C2XSV6_SERVB|nr:hypothetical protein M408DRAFT_242016 [Serendipita vermifera MAFF 305830]
MFFPFCVTDSYRWGLGFTRHIITSTGGEKRSVLFPLLFQMGPRSPASLSSISLDDPGLLTRAFS